MYVVSKGEIYSLMGILIVMTDGKFSFFLTLGIEPRASCMLGKRSSTELLP